MKKFNNYKKLVEVLEVLANPKFSLAGFLFYKTGIQESRFNRLKKFIPNFTLLHTHFTLISSAFIQIVNLGKSSSMKFKKCKIAFNL